MHTTRKTLKIQRSKIKKQVENKNEFDVFWPVSLDKSVEADVESGEYLWAKTNVKKLMVSVWVPEPNMWG